LRVWLVMTERRRRNQSLWSVGLSWPTFMTYWPN
jgi:hypothetical protein